RPHPEVLPHLPHPGVLPDVVADGVEGGAQSRRGDAVALVEVVDEQLASFGYLAAEDVVLRQFDSPAGILTGPGDGAANGGMRVLFCSPRAADSHVGPARDSGKRSFGEIDPLRVDTATRFVGSVCSLDCVFRG